MRRFMLLLILSVPLAACKGQDGPVRSACHAEIKRLCGMAEKAGQCLRSHDDELSSECRAALATRPRQ